MRLQIAINYTRAYIFNNDSKTLKEIDTICLSHISYYGTLCTKNYTLIVSGMLNTHLSDNEVKDRDFVRSTWNSAQRV